MAVCVFVCVCVCVRVCTRCCSLPNIKCFQFLVVLVQRNDLEQTIVQAKPDAAALGVNDAQNSGLWGAANPILPKQEEADEHRVNLQIQHASLHHNTAINTALSQTHRCSPYTLDVTRPSHDKHQHSQPTPSVYSITASSHPMFFPDIFKCTCLQRHSKCFCSILLSHWQIHQPGIRPLLLLDFQLPGDLICVQPEAHGSDWHAFHTHSWHSIRCTELDWKTSPVWSKQLNYSVITVWNIECQDVMRLRSSRPLRLQRHESQGVHPFVKWPSHLKLSLKYGMRNTFIIIYIYIYKKIFFKFFS